MLKVFFLKILFIFRKGEKHLSRTHPDPPTRVSSDWELNRQPFALQDDTQPTEPHCSWQKYFLKDVEQDKDTLNHCCYSGLLEVLGFTVIQEINKRV